jgi:hypothetical protein
MPVGEGVGMDVAANAAAEHRRLEGVVRGHGGAARRGRGGEGSCLNEKSPA